MKTRQIKQYLTVLVCCFNAILFAKLLEETLYAEVFNKIAYGLCLLTLIYCIKLMEELQKGNFQKAIALLK